MSRLSKRAWYERVNAVWPATVPALEADEAVRAARKLYRFAVGRTFRGEVRVSTGNRRTWIRRGVLFVNPGKGWSELVHNLSHWAIPEHSGRHARLERRMIREVIRRGWLDGKLRSPARPPVKRDVRAERYARVLELERVWVRKFKTAQTKLRRLRERRRYYEKQGTVASANRPGKGA